jgi:nucleoside-diphosphate-sugar epimerase
VEGKAMSIDTFRTEEDLEAILATPHQGTISDWQSFDGRVVVLGAGGKMGPTLCMLLRRALPDRATVTAVSRFSDAEVRTRLEAAGVETQAGDLLDRNQVGELPDAQAVFFLAGMKFGASSKEPLTWAMNTYVPALAAERYAETRMVSFSTGNVYPFTPVAGGGATENTAPEPLGEYAQSCLGRERILQYMSERNNMPLTVIRLNYANEPRYGIIVDIARRVAEGRAIDLSMGFVNLIWQGDANNYVARSMHIAEVGGRVLNIAGPETVSVRYLANTVGGMIGKEPVLTGQEEPNALLSNGSLCYKHFGYPSVALLEMIETIVGWVKEGGRLYNKPTKYEVRSGKF